MQRISALDLYSTATSSTSDKKPQHQSHTDVNMSKHISDSFLPSGALDSPRFSLPPSSAISPLFGIPRSVPTSDFIPSPHTATSPKPYMQSRSPSHLPPISPPKTRSPSAENSNAALVEDWRAYTTKLRSQNEGERAHMAADRARMEEVMAEERALWDHERELLKARIAELEAQLGRMTSATISPAVSYQGIPNTALQAMSHTSPPSASTSGSVDGSSKSVQQESGRNPDGSPFYAPAARNPSRTFDPSGATGRVDSISAPRESAIRVTSKELTSSDFIQSPLSRPHDLGSIPENIPESIDISHIQPELEGVPIKTSAVSPTFAAKVLSPQYSPDKLSPNVRPPPRDITNLSPTASTNNASTTKQETKGKGNSSLEPVPETENRRLTMHAGHTPNHSLSKFAWISKEDLSLDSENDPEGEATPRQGHAPSEHIHRPSVAASHFPTNSQLPNQKLAPLIEGSSSTILAQQDDPSLSGPLGLINETSNDEAFLTQLTQRLEEAKKSLPVSPSDDGSERSLSPRGERNVVDKNEDEGPRLRLKPSFNFGRPMGSM